MLRKIWFALLAILLVALMAFLTLPWMLPRPGLDGSIPEQPFADSHFVEIDQVRLHFRARLNGRSDEPLVILLHGFGGSTFSWRHTLDHLEQAGHRAIAVDLPPFGYSQRAGQGANWAELVSGLVDSIDVDSDLVIVGHSMGAAVAARLAASQPERTQALIMVAGTPGMGNRRGGMNPSLVTRIPSLTRWIEVIAAYRLINEDNIRQMLTSAFGREPSSEEMDGYYHPLTIPGTYPALIHRLANERGADNTGWDQVSTHLIWGEKDRWVPLNTGKTLLDRHPNIDIQVMPDTGHNPMDTEPETFNQHLVDLIGR